MSARDRLSDLLDPDPDADTPEACAGRLRLSLRMADAGIKMMRQNLARRNPALSDAEIDEMLAMWLHERPPDAWGRLAPERLSEP